MTIDDSIGGEGPFIPLSVYAKPSHIFLFMSFLLLILFPPLFFLGGGSHILQYYNFGGRGGLPKYYK